MTEREGSIALAVEYRADRFDEVWMRGLLGHYETLLAHLPADMVAGWPRYRCSPPQRKGGCARPSRATARAAGPLCCRSRLFDRARSQPQAGGDLRQQPESYGELERARAGNRDSNSSTGGVKPDDRVGIFLDRSVAAVAAILGYHLAGAAYVPLDPGYPMARNSDVLADAGVRRGVDDVPPA